MIPAVTPETLRTGLEEIERVAPDICCTLRFINSLAIALDFKNPQDLINYISGGTVLDIGSGYNGLAIDVTLRGIPATITPVNPAIRRWDFAETQIDVISMEIASTSSSWLNGYSTEEIERARQTANRNTFPYFAHRLAFPDASFDRVINSFAVFYYAPLDPSVEQKSVFAKSVEEMSRVCKGTIRVADPPLIYGKYNLNWKQRVLDDLGLRSEPNSLGVEIFR